MERDLPGPATSLLEEGRQAYVAVRSKNGPHVTPELYAWSDGKLWFAFAATTLKAKVLARDPLAAVLVTSTARSVVLQGDVELIDARRVGSLTRQVRQLPGVAKAMGRFTIRNAPDLVAFVADTGRGRLGWRPPPMRVLGALTPARSMVIEGDEVVAAPGTWDGDHDHQVTEPPVGGQPVVVALPGPVALPARWFPDEGRIVLMPSILDALDLSGEFPLGIVTDEYVAPGPAAKRGTLLRCQGVRSGSGGAIAVEVERVVDWDGTETTSTAVGG